MSFLEANPLFKGILAISTIAGMSIGLWQWGEGIKRSAQTFSNPHDIAAELLKDEKFLASLIVEMSKNQVLMANITGPTGPRGPEGKSITGPIGPKGEVGPKGDKGDAGTSPSADELTEAVINKIIASAELKNALVKLNKETDQTDTLEIPESESRTALQGAITVSVYAASDSYCQFKVNIGTKSSDRMAGDVGSIFSLSNLGLSGYLLFLSKANGATGNDSCTFIVKQALK